MSYKAVLFDMDGTLLDTLEDLCDSTNHALAQMGYPLRGIEEIRRFIGNGAEKQIRRAVPEGTSEGKIMETLAAFRAYYQDHCQIKTKVYDGLLDVLSELKEKGVKMAVVSNKPDAAVKPLCAHYFPGIFALGETAGCPRKPDKAMVLKAMDAIGVTECIYVGDSEVDVRTAKNAGVPCLSVLWGFRDREQIGGTVYCETVNCLVPMLEEMACGK